MSIILDPERYARARALFHEAAQYKTEERSHFLDQACDSDRELRRAIEQLFAASERSSPVPEGPELRERLLGSAMPTEGFVPQQIGPYRILGRIAPGGMAHVFEAQQEHPHRKVAIKLIHSAWVSPRQAGRFEDEIEILGRLRHENIARIYDSGTVDSPNGPIRYFVMERINGHALRRWAEQTEPSVEQRLQVVAGAARGVAEAHRHGIIHRDLKPQNLLVDSDGTAKVLDFGIARTRNPKRFWKDTRTRAGELLGTLQYMSPEQLQGHSETLDTRTDVYSMGVVLFELLCQELPREMESTTFASSSTHRPQSGSRRLSQVRPDLAGDLDSIVSKALEASPADRYASMDDLVSDLEAYLEQRPIRARPPSPWRRLQLFAIRQRTAFAALAALVFTVLLSIFLIVRFALRTDSARSQALLAQEDMRLETYRAQVSAAGAALDAFDIGSARRSLEAADPELRGWEWKHLNSLLDQSKLVLQGHLNQVCEAQLTRDGSRLFSAGGARFTAPREQAVRAWNLESGHEVWKRTDLGSEQLCLAIHPNERFLVTGGGDDEPNINVWNCSDGEQLQAIETHTRRIEELLFIDRGERMLSASSDGTIEIWKVTGAGQILHERQMANQLGPISNLCLAPNRAYITLYQGGLKAIDRQTGSVIWHRPDHVSALACTSTGSRLALGYTDGLIKLVDVTQSSPALKVIEHFDQRQNVSSLLFSTDERQLIGTGAQQSIFLWDLDSARLAQTLNGHQDQISQVALSSDGKQLVSCSLDRTVRVWDLSTADADPIGKDCVAGTVRALDAEPGGKLYALVLYEGELQVRQSGNDQLLRNWPIQDESIHAVAIDESAGWVYCDEQESIRAFEIHGTEQRIFEGHTDSILALDLHRPSQRLASVSVDGTARIWQLRSPEQVPRTLELQESHTQEPLSYQRRALWSIAWSPDGKHLATCNLKGEAYVWPADFSSEPRALSGAEDGLLRLAWHPSEPRVAAAGIDGKIHLWNPHNGSLERTLSGHANRVRGLCFSPDGARLISASQDRSVRVWNPVDGAEIITLRPLKSPASSLEWGPDQQLIVGHHRGLLVLPSH